MKTFTKIFAVTALLASASTATLAQVSVGGDAGGSVSVDAGSTGVGGGASTGVSAGASTDASGTVKGNSTSKGSLNAAANAATGADSDLNFGSIISDLRTSSTTETDIEALGPDVEITVVTLSELLGNAGDNANALNEAVTAQATAIADLQAAIETDTALSAEVESALSAEGDFTMDDVVAVSTSVDGQLTLVVDDSE